MSISIVCSLYLENMHKLEQTSPTVHQAFVDGKFPVKRTPGCFNVVGGDMTLEQTINTSQKSPAGIIGNSRKKRYVAKWEILLYTMRCWLFPTYTETFPVHTLLTMI